MATKRSGRSPSVASSAIATSTEISARPSADSATSSGTPACASGVWARPSAPITGTAEPTSTRPPSPGFQLDSPSRAAA